MRKRTIILGLLVTIFFNGCTSNSTTKITDRNNDDNLKSENIKNEENSSENRIFNTNTALLSEGKTDFKVINYYPFSDGRAWVVYSFLDDNEEEIQRMAIIDEKGYLQELYRKNEESKFNAFEYYDGATSLYESYEGYLIFEINKIYATWINTQTGEVNSVEAEDNEQILATGGKYYLMLTDNTSFDSNEGKLEIKTYDGTVISSMNVDLSIFKEIYGEYLGKGIFSIRLIGNENTGYHKHVDNYVYLSQNDLVYAENINQENVLHNKFNDSEIVLLSFSYDENRDTVLYYLTNQSEIKSRLIPGSWVCGSSATSNKEGWILLSSNSSVSEEKYPNGPIMSYNLVTEEEYFIGSDISGTEDSKLEFDDNNQATLSIKGADGQIYSAMYNEKLERISEPVLGRPYRHVNDGIQVIQLNRHQNDETLQVRNKDKMIIEYVGEGYDVEGFQNGSCVVKENDTPLGYLGKNGEYLFSDLIDTMP